MFMALDGVGKLLMVKIGRKHYKPSNIECVYECLKHRYGSCLVTWYPLLSLLPVDFIDCLYSKAPWSIPEHVMLSVLICKSYHFKNFKQQVFMNLGLVTSKDHTL